MPFTNVSTTRVHWSEAGTGDCVVLLHGLGGDIGFWQREVTALAATFRVLAIDLRGSGGSDSTPELSIADLADDVAAVLVDAGIDTASVVGFSLGGLVAQEFALRHPLRLNRLVLASTYAVMNAQTRLFLDAVLDVYEGGASSRQMFDLISPWLFSTAFVGDPANAAYFTLPDDAADDQSREDWSTLYRAQRAFDSTARLRDIRADTLIIAGGRDQLVSPSDAATLARGIAAAEYMVIADAGHLTNIENPEDFIEAVRRFV